MKSFINNDKRKYLATMALVVAIPLWFALIGYGFIKLYHYEFKAGSTGHLTEHWPKTNLIQRNKNVYQLVMVAHPHCPCTRASIGELALIMAKGQGELEAHVLFVKPKGVDQEWVETDIYKTAKTIPGVHVVVDEQGQLAKLFGGTTSGQTFLYDQQGKLIFMGGITDSRGHSGDNLGRNSIVALIHHQSTGTQTTPFFGCLLSDKPKAKEELIKG